MDMVYFFKQKLWIRWWQSFHWTCVSVNLWNGSWIMITISKCHFYKKTTKKVCNNN